MPLVAFHEPLGHGHGPNLVDGLAAAALDEGWDVVVFTKEPDPARMIDRRVRFSFVDRLTDRAYSLTRGRHFADVGRRVVQLEPDLFVGLAFDQVVNSPTCPRPPPIPSVQVMHSMHHVRARLPRPRSRMRASVARRNVSRTVRGGSAVVVHSRVVRDEIASIVGGSGSVHEVPWPVASRLARFAEPHPTDRRLLFCGTTTNGKGFETLVAALDLIRAPLVLEFTSEQPSDALRAVQATSNRVVHPQSWSDSDAYHAAYSRAMVAVLPYESVVRPGYVSGTLLDVLVHRVPAVISDALAGLLPVGYRAVLTFPQGDPRALARSIDEAFERHEELVAAADIPSRQLLDEHSYERYFQALVGCGRGGSPGPDPMPR